MKANSLGLAGEAPRTRPEGVAAPVSTDAPPSPSPDGTTGPRYTVVLTIVDPDGVGVPGLKVCVDDEPVARTANDGSAYLSLAAGDHELWAGGVGSAFMGVIGLVGVRLVGVDLEGVEGGAGDFVHLDDLSSGTGAPPPEPGASRSSSPRSAA